MDIKVEKKYLLEALQEHFNLEGFENADELQKALEQVPKVYDLFPELVGFIDFWRQQEDKLNLIYVDYALKTGKNALDHEGFYEFLLYMYESARMKVEGLSLKEAASTPQLDYLMGQSEAEADGLEYNFTPSQLTLVFSNLLELILTKEEDLKTAFNDFKTQQQVDYNFNTYMGVIFTKGILEKNWQTMRQYSAPNEEVFLTLESFEVSNHLSTFLDYFSKMEGKMRKDFARLHANDQKRFEDFAAQIYVSFKYQGAGQSES